MHKTENGPLVTDINLTIFVMTMAQAMVRNAVRWEGDAMAGNIGELHRICQHQKPGHDFPYHLPQEANHG